MRTQRMAGWLATFFAVLTVSVVAGQAPDGPPAPTTPPKEKQTRLGLYLTAREAFEKWKAEPDKVTIIDVRTTEEYVFVGHPEMAWNIPVTIQTWEWDPARKHFAMKPNSDFVAQVKELFPPDRTLLLLCRSGGRSARAADLLAEAGFRNVYSITDGMEGALVNDPANVFHGQRMKNGWKNSGLPWTYQPDPARMRLPKQP